MLSTAIEQQFISVADKISAQDLRTIIECGNPTVAVAVIEQGCDTELQYVLGVIT